MTTIGEVYHPDPSVTSFFAGGERRFDGVDSGVTTVFDYPMYFALRDVLAGKAPAAKLTDVLRHDSLYSPDQLVTFFGNHDTTRFAGAEWAGGIWWRRFVGEVEIGVWFESDDAWDSTVLLRR